MVAIATTQIVCFTFLRWLPLKIMRLSEEKGQPHIVSTYGRIHRFLQVPLTAGGTALILLIRFQKIHNVVIYRVAGILPLREVREGDN